MRIPSYSVVNPKDSSGDGLYSRFKRTIHNAVNSKGFKNIRQTVENLLHDYLKNISAADVIRFASTVAPLILAEEHEAQDYDYEELRYYLTQTKKSLSYTKDDIPVPEQALRLVQLKQDLDTIISMISPQETTHLKLDIEETKSNISASFAPVTPKRK